MINIETNTVIKRTDFNKLVKKSGLTSKELSQKSGVPYTYISSLRTGNTRVKTIKNETWEKLKPYLPEIK